MNDVPMAAQNMVRALLCISWVLFGPLLIHIWNVFVFQSLVHWWAAFVVDAAVLIPFIVAEQVGRWRSR
jgi:membrane protein YdbS with pleckstrin-like domain